MMTTATHYDAFDFLNHVVNRALQPQARANACRPAAASQAPQETRLIRLDVTESPEAYLVVAELPGVKKEVLEVVIEGKQVSLQAEIQRPETVEGVVERQLMEERFYGKLSRRIQLPQEIDDTAAAARFADGLLILQLPKKKVTGLRKLEIH